MLNFKSLFLIALGLLAGWELFNGLSSLFNSEYLYGSGRLVYSLLFGVLVLLLRRTSLAPQQTTGGAAAGKRQAALLGPVVIGLMGLGVFLWLAVLRYGNAQAPWMAEFLAPSLSGQLAFASNRDQPTACLPFVDISDCNLDVYRMNAAGSGATRLTTAGGNAPRWSPDGEQITFVSTRQGEPHLYMMNSDGSEQTVVMDEPVVEQPALSPDGTRLAFVSAGDIYVSDAAGGDRTPLTDHPADDNDPAWSPDGGRLAFVSNRDGQWDLYLINANGGEPARLTDDQAAESSPAWSPDGTRLAFVSDRDGNPEIYLINAGGGEPARLTRTRNSSNGTPAWSPDGTRLAFVSDRDGNPEIYLMNADGSRQARITYSPAVEWDPAWASE